MENKIELKGLMPVVMAIVMSLAFCIQLEDTVAATDPVKIWDYKTAEHRVNISVVAGKVTENIYGYKTDGITEKSHTWSVDNADICKVDESDGRVSITGLKEGITKLNLKVQASDGRTYTDYTYVSVYTAFQSANGKTTTTTRASRSAHAGSDNKNERANLPKGTTVNVYGKCGNYYRATVSYTFTDGLDTNIAYILASDVTIPITKLSLNKTNLTIKEGEESIIVATVFPSTTTENKMATYTVGDKSKATVYKDGVVLAKNKGKTIITVKCGSITAKCTVNVTGAQTEQASKSTKKIKGNIGNKYRYSFINERSAFGRKYKLDRKLRNLLAKKLVSAGYYKSVGSAKSAINSMLRVKWRGSCYGMAITTALNKKKQINVRAYTKSKGKKNQLNKVPKPKNRKSVANIINYYHASQLGFNQVEKRHSANDKKALKAVVKNAKKGYVQSFSFFMESKKNSKKKCAHRILIFNYVKKRSSKKWLAIESYDNSYSSGKRYVYIHKDYNKIKVQGWSKAYKIYAFRYNTNFGKYAKIKIK